LATKIYNELDFYSLKKVGLKLSIFLLFIICLISILDEVKLGFKEAKLILTYLIGIGN